MSLAVPYHFTTTASTNLQPLGMADQGGNVKGIIICGGTVATAIYIKFYWGAQPTIGTTVPGVTIGNAATTNAMQTFPDGITGNGQLWVAVTGAQGDSDSSNAAAGIQITVLVE